MNTDENELFSKNFKYLRRKMNLKQEELAAKLFVTPQAISKWETNKSIPNIQMLITISKLFHISVDELLNVDLETNHEQEKEIEMEMDASSSITTESNVPMKRNILIFNKNAKSYKRFIITSILFFVFFALLIPTFFFPYDIYTLVGLGLAMVMNLIIFIYQIKIMCHRNQIGHVYISSTLEHRKVMFKIALPINFALLILVTSFFLVFQEFQESLMLFYYIYLIVSICLLAVIELLNFIFYDQALQDAERI